MKHMLYITLMAITIAIISSVFGYHTGIQVATTSNGWIENDKFVLEVNGQCYEWFIK